MVLQFATKFGTCANIRDGHSRIILRWSPAISRSEY